MPYRIVIGGEVYRQALRKPNVDPRRTDMTFPPKERLPESARATQIDRPWLISTAKKVKRLYDFANLLLDEQVTEADYLRELRHTRDYLSLRLLELPLRDPG